MLLNPIIDCRCECRVVLDECVVCLTVVLGLKHLAVVDCLVDHHLVELSQRQHVIASVGILEHTLPLTQVTSDLPGGIVVIAELVRHRRHRIRLRHTEHVNHVLSDYLLLTHIQIVPGLDVVALHDDAHIKRAEYRTDGIAQLATMILG